METKRGFTKMTVDEFEAWLPRQSIARTVRTVQQHHTFVPNYALFDGSNHFGLQTGMKNHHVNHNGWADIGQHLTIFPDGVVVTGRPFNRTPACIGDANANCVCIENLGDFDAGRDAMTDAQRTAIVRVTAALIKKFGLGDPDTNNIVYHHWFDSSGRKKFGVDAVKSCPGTAFFGGNKRDDFDRNFKPLVQRALGAEPAPAVAPAETPSRWVSVTANRLNVRSGPSASDARAPGISPVEFGSVLRVFGERNGWVKISSGKDHWVSGRYTQDVEPVTVNTDGTNCRSGPGTDHAVVAVFHEGERLFVHEASGSWSRVGVDRWVHESLLDR